MEFLSSTLSTSPPPALPFLTWKTPSSLTIPYSRKLLPHPSRRFRISAHFGRPTNRQNHLRKKLTQQQQQVSHRQNPLQEFDKVDVFEPKLYSSGQMSENLVKSSSLDDEFDNDSEDGKKVEGSDVGGKCSEKDSEMGLEGRKFGESIMWNKLESWVEQYKKDTEFWGIGSGPIFSVFHDSEGKVERVVVNEEEILRRNRVDPRLDSETGDLSEVSFKISFAKDLAKEMESGSNVIPKNSSVAKFSLSGGESRSRLVEAIQSVRMTQGSISRMSRVGVFVLCGLAVVWAVKGLFTVGEESKEITRLEKEMLRRKMKARAEKEKVVKGSVEVMQDPVQPEIVPFRRPQLHREELVNSIAKGKGSNSKLDLVEYSGYVDVGLKDKIEEIRAMARHAREVEKKDSSSQDDVDGANDEDYQGLNELFSRIASPKSDVRIQEEEYEGASDEVMESIMSYRDPKDDIEQSTNGASDKKREKQTYSIPNGAENSRRELSNKKLVSTYSNLNEADLHSDGPDSQSGSQVNPLRKKWRIIKSAKEAREYLAKNHRQNMSQTHEVREDEQTDIATTSLSVGCRNTSQILDLNDKVYDSSSSMGSETARENVGSLSDLEMTRIASREVNIRNEDASVSDLEIPATKEKDVGTSPNNYSENEVSSFLNGKSDSTSTEVDCGGSILRDEMSTPPNKRDSEDTEENDELMDLEAVGTANDNEVKDKGEELAPPVNKESWIEKNFHEFEPIVNKIGVAFRNNYQVAREKASQELGLKDEVMELKSDDAENELEWMKDERLREIVFKVRDNELSGRDPFHLMDEEEKKTFFGGLEKKVEQENEKLLKLHEYFHSNIENLDYGADGISLYDPPEKIIPRWKVPPAEKSPEFLNNFKEQRKTLVAESLKNSFLSQKSGIKNALHKSTNESTPEAGDVSFPSKELDKDNLSSSKTIIEGSDGSVRAGKRSGREYWQHTKKWSQGFLESYNAETDPEVKAVMRDMGKDLDRWITEKEIQEAADLMDRVPEKGQKFIKQKLEKVKREMELFGPQAVLSKYSEYSEAKEEDYLWWLDLPFVLCIELYTLENGQQRVGFYSLEMAADLELDPKQYHVIAFEDAGECKNLCYIIQAHMEMLGNENAFVVARPPKEAFREAKENGFSVTVIRKGELKLNIAQTLEEVEESIVEIGSKIYHDKITKERSVDINALMKGVFGVSKPTKRKRSKRKSKRRIKP